MWSLVLDIPTYRSNICLIKASGGKNPFGDNGHNVDLLRDNLTFYCL